MTEVNCSVDTYDLLGCHDAYWESQPVFEKIQDRLRAAYLGLKGLTK